jgi:hypothetical protein
VQADAGVTILKTKWGDAELGLTASTPWKRFRPDAKGTLRFRF